MATVAKQNTPDNYVFGRPAKYNLKELAAHLQEWSRDERHWDLCKWCDEADIDPTAPSQWCEVDEDFRKAWLQSKNRIAARRTEMHVIGELPPTVYNKYQHNYDVMHYQFEEAHREREAKRQAKAKAEAEKEAQTPQASEKLDAVMHMLSNLQSSAALNKAERSMSKAE